MSEVGLEFDWVIEALSFSSQATALHLSFLSELILYGNKKTKNTILSHGIHEVYISYFL